MKDLQQKSRDELQRLAAELSERLRDMRFKTMTREFTKVHQVQETKRDLSRVETILKATQPSNV